MPGFDSIRGRYLFATGFFVLLVLTAGWLAQAMVNEAADQSSQNATERDQINHLINDLNSDLWATENALQGFLLSPHQPQKAATLGAFDHIAQDISRLADSEWIKHDRQRGDRVVRVRGELAELEAQTRKLIAMRSDPEKLFPAMRYMLDNMLPSNIDFTTFATLAVDQARAQTGSTQQEIERLFSDARYSWVQMINSFRGFLTNRFDIAPGDPLAGMQRQRGQVGSYHDSVDRQLAALAALDHRGRLELEQSESLTRMQAISRDWFHAFQVATSIYGSERWRLDVPLLRDTIRPLFEHLWVDLDTLRTELEGDSAKDMTSLTGVASQLSRSLWLISILTIVLTLVGYLFFEHVVRRPIARVAAGLKAEARGANVINLPLTTTHETRDLIAAFEHMRAQVRSRQERLQSILENTAEGIITFDAEGVIESCNTAVKNLFGWHRDEAIGTPITDLVQRDPARPAPDSYTGRFLECHFDQLAGIEGELVARRQSTNFPMAIKIGAMRLDGRKYFTAVVADISERKAMVEHLRLLAEHDDLTGLYNRSFFLGEIDRVVERLRRSPHVCSLLYIDLDNFKYVNDTLGHLSGDRLLVEVSDLLRRRARRSDLMARLGGDEFTILLYDTGPEEAHRVAETFRQALADFQFRQEGEVVNIGCSIGVTGITTETRSAQEALSHADFACHMAKRGGRNRIHVFEKSDEVNVAALSLDIGWTRRIKDAIREDRFVLAGQPIVDARSAQPVIYEVLLRLRDEHDNIVMPDGFLPTAERFGLAADIDRWVITHAIRSLAGRRRSVPGLRYSINVSAQTLSHADVADTIIQELAARELDPSALIFEVTETSAIADMQVAEQFLGRLKGIGCYTALDDFGSGMSSFAYLRDLPVDYVKIDGRFVRQLHVSTVDQAMVRAMNDIAHALGKKTIAEFVENEASFQLLQGYGLDYAQGYHLGRPMLLSSLSESDGDHKVTVFRNP